MAGTPLLGNCKGVVASYVACQAVPGSAKCRLPQLTVRPPCSAAVKRKQNGSRRRTVSTLLRNWAHLASSMSLNFEAKEDNGWHGARVAFVRAVSRTQSIERSLLGWIGLAK